MTYTVKQLAELAGISVRTLHYYDEIGLLKPSSLGENGYRYYDDDAVLRLQQILFFRELGLSLKNIGAVIDTPGFDVLAALEAHREALAARIARLGDLIDTVDRTISNLKGEVEVSKKQLFQGFSEEDEKRYADEARERWGADAVDATYKRWDSYTAEKQERIKAEGQEIYQDMVSAMAHGPESPQAQAVVARWHENLRYFYEPSEARLRGLGQLYVEDPAFAGNFRELHSDLPEFMQSAINHYVDGLAGE